MESDDLYIYKMCYVIAQKAHKGQLRRDGYAYIDHPKELASMFTDWIDKSIAILHDTLEDGACNGVTEQYIKDKFDAFGKEHRKSVRKLKLILDAVKGLTHDPKDTYIDYIEDVVAKGLTKFKIMDIFINISDAPTPRQVEKYDKAMKILVY